MLKFGRATKAKEPMKVLREASTAELDELFRQITADAAKEALAAGLPITGTDQRGRTVQSKTASLPEDASDPPSEQAAADTDALAT